MKYKITLNSSNSEITCFESNNFFKAFKEYIRLKFKYLSLNIKLLYRI